MEGDQNAPAYEAHAPYNQQVPPVPQAQPGPTFLMTDNQMIQLLAATQAAANQQPAQPQAPAPAPAARPIRPREPDPFDGTVSQYRTWKSQMIRYLASSPETPENQQITIVLGNIRGAGVDGWVNAYTDEHFDIDNMLWVVSLTEVWTELDQTYTDRLAERTALRHIETLKQAQCRDAADYFQKFEGYVREAGLGTDAQLVLEWAKRGTHARIMESIHRMPEVPQTYVEWKASVIKLEENWLRYLASEPGRAEPHAQRAGTRNTNTQGTVPAGNREPAQPAMQAAPPVPPAPQGRRWQQPDPTGITYGGRGQPMDIDRAAGQPAVCFRCGRKRYEGGDCNNRWHRVPGAGPPPRVPPGQARIRAAWEGEDFRSQVREWAQQDPDSFREAGFGVGAP